MAKQNECDFCAHAFCNSSGENGAQVAVNANANPPAVAAAAVVGNPQNVVVAAAAANPNPAVVPVVPAAAAAVNPNLANQEADVAQVIAGVNAVGGQPAQGAGANAVVPGGQPEVGQEFLLTHPWRGNVGDWEGKYKTQFLDTQEFDNARTVGVLIGFFW